MKELRFRVQYRQFQPGDTVPAAWDHGVRGTLAQVGKAEWVEVPDAHAPVDDPAKAMTESPADKMLRPAPRIKRKGVA